MQEERPENRTLLAFFIWTGFCGDWFLRLRRCLLQHCADIHRRDHQRLGFRLGSQQRQLCPDARSVLPILTFMQPSGTFARYWSRSWVRVWMV